MFAQSLRASRSSLARLARQQAMTKRTFIAPTAARGADLVQSLYLNELKNFKPTPVKANDADAHVQKFAPPAAPKAPEDVDITSDLKAYETSAVEVEGQAEAGAPVEAESDWFEEEPEEEHAAAH